MTDRIIHPGKDTPLYILRGHRIHDLHTTLKLNNPKLEEIVLYERPTQSAIIFTRKLYEVNQPQSYT